MVNTVIKAGTEQLV